MSFKLNQYSALLFLIGVLICGAYLYVTDESTFGPNGDSRTQHRDALVPRPNSLDPAVPVDIGSQIPSGKSQESAIYSEFKVLIKSNPKEALDFVQRHFSGNDAKRVFKDFLIASSSDDLTGIEQALLLMPPQSQKGVCYPVFTHWGSKDPYRLVAYAKRFLPDQLRVVAEEKAFEGLLHSNNLPGAEALVSEMLRSTNRAQCVALLAEKRKFNSVEDIKTWVSNLDAADREAAESRIAFVAITNQSPQYLADLANSFTSTSAKKIATDGLAAKLAHEDPAVAEEWLNALPESMTESVFGRYIAETAKKDVGQAMNMAVQISGRVQRERAFDAIQSQVTAVSFEKTAEWIAGIPKDMQGRAAFQLASRWKQVNRDKALAWIDSLSDHVVKERAKAGFGK